MKFVVDASFIASLLLPDESSRASDRLAGTLVSEGSTAPALFQLEVTNILLMARRRGRITGTQLMQLSDAFDLLPIHVQPALTVQQRGEVQRLAERHILSAYDAAYLELSMRTGLSLVSLDKSLAKAAKAEGIELWRVGRGGGGKFEI
jgi:predicted nucleic acid-binding protein